MRRNCVVVIALWMIAQMGWAIDQSYYSSIDNKKGASLRDNLYTITSVGPSGMSYNGLWAAYATTDVYPADSVGKAGKIWDMYSNVLWTVGQKQCGNYDEVGDCYNREHSVPKSWFGDKTPAYYDLGHLVPTDGYVNNQRGNDPFGECAGGERLTNGSYRATGRYGNSTFPGYTSIGKVFEPDDQYKGDFARIYMYMAVRDKKGNKNDVSISGKMFNTSDTNFGFTDYSVALLMKWHRMDPVSRKEVDRNNGMQSEQGNRNPFIDYPILAEFLWGNKVGETFTFANALASFDPEFIWGESNGWRGEDIPPTPPGPVIKHGVTWFVCGVETQVDSIIENAMISTLPDVPASCSEESPVFMGWTTAPIDGIEDDEPAVLYTKLADFPAVTKNVTYYAVFAKETLIEGGIEPATYTYNTTQKDGWTNTAVWTNNAYWLLKQGGEVLSPEVELSGLSSISMKMRTFGGTGNPTVTISVAGNTIASLTASNKNINEYSWTNAGSLSGTSPLRFTAEKSSSQGVGFTEIVIQVSGEGVTASYERFITDYQSTTEIKNLKSTIKNQKLLIKDQLYILVGDQLFNLQGQRVK